MSLFRRNYQAERQFMRHNYIRLRGRTWFLTLYGILSTLFVCAFVIYCTILLDFLIRVTGSYLSTFGNYLRSNIWQSPNQEDFLNMAKAVFMPANMFSIFGRLTIVTTIFMLIMFLLFEKLWALGKVYDWYQTFRDLTRNTNRFATVREVDTTYKLVPDRNKFYSGAPGQPVLHTSGYTLEFFMFHPFLWAIQWVKRPLGMNSLEFSGIYKRLRPTLIARFPNLYKNQLTVKGGFEGFYWVDTSNTHSKTTGMTRSSKDQMRGYPLIDILRRAEVKWNIVDTDAKNEDAKMSFQALREAGYDVRLLNIMEPSESESWNPLELAIDYAFDGDWDNVNTELSKVVQVIGGSAGEETTQKDIWDSAAESTIRSVMLAVLDIAVRHQDKSMVTIANVLQFINDMSHFSDSEGDGLTKYINMLGTLPRTPVRNMIRLNASEYLSATGDTKSSISFSVMNRLNLFASESITRLTSFNTINLTDLGFPRILKFKFSKSFAGLHVGVNIFEKDKHKPLEKDKLTISQSGVLTYPIHHKLPAEWQIELNLDQSGNAVQKRKLRYILNGQIVQRRRLNGQLKLDKYSKQPEIKCLINTLKAIGTTEKPEVELRYSERPMAVFIVTPQSNDDFSALASLFISQVFSVNTDIASRITRRKMDNWILYKLNEFSMFPRIPGFTNILTRGLTYGHLVDLYIQTLTQPRLHYSEMETNDINGNTGNWFHILSNDEQTNEALSKQLGEIEVQTESVNSQIGLDRQDCGNRMVQLNKVRLLDAKEIGELTPREMITIRTIKRTDKKGQDVRPLPIFATENYSLPMAYKLLGKKFSLDYYTADLNLKARYNQLAYDDLYQNFKPFFDELRILTNEAQDVNTQRQTSNSNGFIDEVVAADVPSNNNNGNESEEERLDHWFVNIDWNGPFLTEEQLAQQKVTHDIEDLIRVNIPRDNYQNDQQITASTSLQNHTFMNLNRNNNYQVIYDLIGRNKKTLWKIYQEIPQEGEI
ncbi:conjugal transfer protein [Leuconostoc lactis]|uniref:type IV secretory system conjugative DNA transfer family protein n=1 Tax=Leuconostoc lactis TaxID=1246 RepID=UPI0024A05339|nr:type IV secretory system conjugative DNA transfer family protein [Leuconostoc lactis]GLY46150.1 conjugal transfer protein [Leuconostoc lactis]